MFASYDSVMSFTVNLFLRGSSKKGNFFLRIICTSKCLPAANHKKIGNFAAGGTEATKKKLKHKHKILYCNNLNKCIQFTNLQIIQSKTTAGV